jgi:hypothetical protein
VDETNADAVLAAAQVLAARQALLSPDLGSLQEEHLLAIVAAADLTMGSGLPLLPSERRGSGEPY